MTGEFVRASRLYDVGSRTPIAHPAAQATDRDVREAIEATGREAATDGGHPSGPERCWDQEDCPQDDCDGELQQQDRFNVMCLQCGATWTHIRDADTHYLQPEIGEIDAQKLRDGGRSR